MAHAVGQHIGEVPSLAGIHPVAGGGVIEVVEVGTSLHRVLHQLVIRFGISWVELAGHVARQAGQCVELAGDPFEVTVMGEAKGVGVDQLGLAHAKDAGVAGQQLVNLAGMFAAELPCGPFTGIVFHVVDGHDSRVPGQVEEKGGGQFHGLDVAHVHDPQAVDLVVPAQLHLFPDAWQGVGVKPFIIAGTSHIVEMVIHAAAALA